MQGNYVKALLSLVQGYGISHQQLLAGTGISPACLKGDINLDDQQFFTLCERALALTADPALGLRFGERLNISTHGVLGYALMSSATVGDVLQLLLQYHRMLQPSMRLQLIKDSDHVYLECRALHLNEQLERFLVECFYAAVRTSGSFLLGDRTIMVTLELDYPAPAYAGIYDQVFGFPVSFNSKERRMSFQRDTLSLPLSTANPAVEAIFREQCSSLLSSLGQQAPVSARVQHILLFRSGEFPAVEQVARQLFMSERTLRRRLHEEGNSFQQLLDQVRFQLSKEYLRNTQLPISEIARLVGFSDSPNFRRSFKRWSGSSQPSCFR